MTDPLASDHTTRVHMAVAHPFFADVHRRCRNARSDGVRDTDARASTYAQRTKTRVRAGCRSGDFTTGVTRDITR
ncbi:hypothetical protein ACWGST_08240 [Agromyces sp. NPDC055520]